MLTEIARQYQAKAQADESPRTRFLALLDAYYAGCQYDFLPRAWHEITDNAGQPVPFRSRRPSTVLPFGRGCYSRSNTPPTVFNIGAENYRHSAVLRRLLSPPPPRALGRRTAAARDPGGRRPGR